MNAKEKEVILMNVDEIKSKLRPVFDAVPVYRAILSLVAVKPLVSTMGI